MKKISRTMIAIAMAAQISAGAALAANTSTTEASSVWSKFSSGYTGAISGPSLKFDGFQPNGVAGEPLRGDPISWSNSISLNYKLDSKISAFVNPRFDFQPVMGMDFTLLNTRIGIKAANAYSYGALKLAYVNVTFELPTTKLSLDQGLVFAPGSFTILNVKIGGEKSPWILGSYNDMRFYVFNTEPNAADLKNTKDFKFDFNPFISYTFSDQFTLEGRFDVSTKHVRGGPGAGFAPNDKKNIALAFNVDVIPKWTLVPTVTAFPFDDGAKVIDADNVQLGLEIYGAFF